MELEETLADIAPNLYRLALGLTGNRQEAEDVTQESLGALISYWRRHGRPESPSAFACTVVRRQAIRRGIKRRGLLPLDDRLESADPAPGPEAWFGQAQALERALGALGKLDGVDREAILLVAAAGLSVEEASKVSGISPSAFKMRVHRARRRLAQEMEKDHGSGNERLDAAL